MELSPSLSQRNYESQEISSLTDVIEDEDKDTSTLKKIVKKLEARFLKKDYFQSHLFDEQHSSSPTINVALNPLNFLKDFYTGNNVRSEIYQEHYEEGEIKKPEEHVKESEKVDMSYQDVMKIIKTKVMNDLFKSTMEHIDASLKEKWEFLKIFPSYRVIAMLSYQSALT